MLNEIDCNFINMTHKFSKSNSQINLFLNLCTYKKWLFIVKLFYINLYFKKKKKKIDFPKVNDS